MIVLLTPDASAAELDAIEQAVRAMDLEPTRLDDSKGRAFEVTGPDRGRVLELRGTPGVAEILTRRRALAGGEPLWPHFALRICILILLLVTTLVLLAAFVPPGLGDRADPAPGASQPGALEWPLRPLAGYLDLVPGRLGGLSVLVMWLVFLVWPFIDRTEETTPGGRRAVRLIRLAGVGLLVFVIVLGIGATG